MLRTNLLRYLKTTAAAVVVASSSTGIINKADAKTYFDTDVYGDKELKIATVNKLKQKLRNGILSNPSIAADLLKVAINDALGYDIGSQDGGPDGSIQFEADLDHNKGLSSAISLMQDVKKQLQRTNSVSFADVCAFAGAEALETVGCGRVVVQVGRVDSKDPNLKSIGVDFQNPTGPSQVLAGFSSSGLGPKEAVVLIGALGEINRIVSEASQSSSASSNEVDEEDKEFEEQPFVPTTFGARDAIYGTSHASTSECRCCVLCALDDLPYLPMYLTYLINLPTGAKIGKGDFSSRYLSGLLRSKGGADRLGACLLADGACRALVEKYASNEPAFKQDVAEVYLRLTLLGEVYSTRNS